MLRGEIYGKILWDGNNHGIVVWSISHVGREVGEEEVSGKGGLLMSRLRLGGEGGSPNVNITKKILLSARRR